MGKRSFLYEEQENMKAKIVPFAGWDMPVQYSGIIDEHNTVRSALGLFDVSHMGEVFVTGSDALDFLQSIVPQDVSKLTDSRAVYCQLTNKKGGIIDDLIIYKLKDENYLLIVNASRIDVDVNWITLNSLNYDVKIENASHNYSLLALQGPNASALIEKLGCARDIQPEYFSIQPATIAGIDLMLSRTGYTGEDGFELMVENKYVVQLWKTLLREGKELGIKPIGLGARDTLRLEVALPLWGNDIDEDTTPVEAGLTWSVAKDKKENYNGKDVIMGQIAGTIPLRKKLVGFEMIDKAIPRHEYEVYYEGNKVGVVTSGAPAPSKGSNIGLAHIYLDDNSIFLNKTIGINIDIMVRNKLYKAQIVKKPFVQKKNSVKN
ncbi:glycine cleavage system aminomethyltransferase GcvT [bacterium]|nr:glycine cleavage system aminomethyltransferase GcvT [bacterium]